MLSFLALLLFSHAVNTAVISSGPQPASTARPSALNASQLFSLGNVSIDYVLTGFDECQEKGLDINHIKDGFSEMIQMLEPERFDPFLPAKFPEYWGDDWRTSSFIDFWGPSEKSAAWRDDFKGMLDLRVSF